MPVEILQKSARKGSKRLRRLTWTAAALVVLLAICAVITWRIRKDNQPDEYVPGEASNDITNIVADRGAQKSATSPEPPKTVVSTPAVDHLLDPGRKLPAGAPEPLFTDVTKAAGLASFRQFQGSRTSQ